jgi:hypothetical protein
MMAGRALDDDGSIADLPWAAVFDPAANVRALGAIQARGFRAATEVVDRFVRLAERSFGTARAPSSATESEGVDPGSYPELGRILGSWQAVAGQLGRSVQAPAAPEPGFDLVNSNATGEAYLEATEPGPTVTEVWLHNRGQEDLGKVRLRCSDLLAHDGMLIDSSCIRFEPDMVPMPARSSRGVTVEVDVTQQHQPGRYRGTMLADGHDDVWLPVVLNIKPRVS